MRMGRRGAALALALLLLLGGCGTRLDKTSEFLKYKDKEKIEQIEALCRDFFEEQGLVGLSVGVLDQGKVRFFNLGTLEADGRPVNEDTRFDLGSLTQVFTGVAFGESVYRRHLGDGSVLANYFPYLSLPEWEGGKITYGQLATHRSGLPAQPGNLPREEVPYAFYDELALRRYLSKAELEARPGESFRPDGIDMGLLGFALEVARKTPFEQHVKNIVMYSIGMTRSTATFDEKDTDYPATWATPHDAGGNPLPHQEYAALQGMAAFKSTAYDLMLFAWCNMNMPGTENTFTKPEAEGRSVEDQLYLSSTVRVTAEDGTVKSQVDPDIQAVTVETIKVQSVMERLHAGMRIAQDEHYASGGLSLGYGYRLGTLGGAKYVWQAGGDQGNGGYIGFVPKNGTAVVVLANKGVDVAPLGEAALELLNGR